MAYRWDRFIGRQESATSYVACRMNSAISPSGEVRSQSAGSCNAFAFSHAELQPTRHPSMPAISNSFDVSVHAVSAKVPICELLYW